MKMSQNVYEFVQSGQNNQVAPTVKTIADKYLDKITLLEEEIAAIEKKLFLLLDEHGIEVLDNIEL
jgi:trimethylamine:corrinoid methyltransferase-like protein